MSDANDLTVDGLKEDFDVSIDGQASIPLGNQSTGPSWQTVVLVLVIAFFAWQYFDSPKPSPNPHDDTIIVDDEKQPKPDPDNVVDYSGATIYFINEKPATSADEKMVIAHGTSDAFIASRKLEGFRWWDEEQDEAKAIVDHAVAKNTPPPIVALIRDKTVLRLAPIPKTVAELEALLK